MFVYFERYNIFKDLETFGLLMIVSNFTICETLIPASELSDEQRVLVVDSHYDSEFLRT